MFELPMPLPALPACPPVQAPPSSQRLIRRAERHIAGQRFEEAVCDLRRAITLGADACDCMLRIADLEARRQRWPCALRAAEQAIQLAPERAAPLEMLLAIAMQAGDHARALAAGQTLVRRMPRHLTAHDALGAIYIQMGEIDAALRVFNTLTRLNPRNPAHHLKKGLLCQHQGEIALAVHAFSRALELDPDGQVGAEARDAMETLDAFQLNHILTLGMDDAMFRIRLRRDPGEAAAERGFALSEQGALILAELCAHLLSEALPACRVARYN